MIGNIHLRGAALALAMLLAGGTVSAQTTLDSTATARLAALGRLWVAIKYFHPSAVAKIDWDQAAFTAIPNVIAARDSAQYADAVAGMLAALNDPATRLVSTRGSEPPTGGPATSRLEPDSALIIDLTSPAALADFAGTAAALGKAATQVPAARTIIIDLRVPGEIGAEGGGVLGYVFGSLDRALTSNAISGPGRRRRVHSGIAPRFGSTSGGYSAGYRIADGATFPAGSGREDQRIAFLVNRWSPLPPIALALQQSGRGVIVAEGPIDDRALVETETIPLGPGLSAQVRATELLWKDGTLGFAPDTTMATTGAATIAAATAFAARPGPRPTSRPAAEAGSPPPPDEGYQSAPYPPLTHRILAGFRIWGVFRHFFPYRAFFGEDWDAELPRALTSLAAARDSLEYALAVAEMVTHIHDSHAFVSSPTLFAWTGLYAPAGIRTRLLDGKAVIEELTGSPAPGLSRGDLVESVDGEPVPARTKRLARAIAHSTPQALANRLGDLLLNGPKDSEARLVVRQASGRTVTVTLPRTRHVFQQPLPPRRSSEAAVRLLPGNIGYADLARLPIGSVDSMFRAFEKTAGIVFDMRGYPLGTAWSIAPRLASEPRFAAACFWRFEPESPNEDVQSLSRFAQVLEAAGPRYRNPTVMLIDERAISQAEHTGLLLRAANGTVLVGSPTQGANGDVTNFVVPGGITVSLSGQGVEAIDGTPLQRKGLTPDVPVRPTIAGIRAGRDEVLDRAVQYLRAGGRLAKKPVRTAC